MLKVLSLILIFTFCLIIKIRRERGGKKSFYYYPLTKETGLRIPTAPRAAFRHGERDVNFLRGETYILKAERGPTQTKKTNSRAFFSKRGGPGSLARSLKNKGTLAAF